MGWGAGKETQKRCKHCSDCGTNNVGKRHKEQRYFYEESLFTTSRLNHLLFKDSQQGSHVWYFSAAFARVEMEMPDWNGGCVFVCKRKNLLARRIQK